MANDWLKKDINYPLWSTHDAFNGFKVFSRNAFPRIVYLNICILKVELSKKALSRTPVKLDAGIHCMADRRIL